MTHRDRVCGYALGSIHITGWPGATRASLLAQISMTVPAVPAGIELNSFITSIRQTVSPDSTAVPTSTNGGAPGVDAR